MSIRKFESNYSKIQKNRRIESLIASQKGTTNEFEQSKMWEDMLSFFI